VPELSFLTVLSENLRRQVQDREIRDVLVHGVSVLKPVDQPLDPDEESWSDGGDRGAKAEPSGARDWRAAGYWSMLLASVGSVRCELILVTA